MPNTYFQFKRFRIDQEHCAMKVCTDACIQGAYAAQWLKENTCLRDEQRILDIGTGTGLLALMLAQQLPSASIDALEIDENAFMQAVKNIKHTIWAERINVFNQDIRYWDSDTRYNFVICNPPFFGNDLKSSNLLKNQAKHAVTLDQHMLLNTMKKHLLPSGFFCIMLPPREFKVFREMALQNGISVAQILQVKQSVASGVFRMIGIFCQGIAEVQEEGLSIHDEYRNYTFGFKALLKEYYLHL